MNIKRNIIALFISISIFLSSGCSTLFNSMARGNLDEPKGEVILSGIDNPVIIRRDEYGVPFVEAQSLKDLSFGVGYSMAEDRLAQMISMSMLARGRLSEMVGPVGVDMDIYMRAMGIPQLMKEKYKLISDDLKINLESFSAGINAYIQAHKKKLPLELKLNSYEPEPWEPDNTVGLFAILNMGVGFNMQEELALLELLERVGAEKLAYMAPIYPDEPIDFEESKKLKQIEKAAKILKPDIEQLAQVGNKFKHITGQGLAASNNWAVHLSKTKTGASLVANDTHLLMSQPSNWALMGVRCPEYSGVGIGFPGIPSLVAGYNGHIAWGETMVMADSQDIFLEELRTNEDGVTEYLYKGKWLPVEERKEIIKVKGGKDVTLTVQSTVHGPLLNRALSAVSKHDIIPKKTGSKYGLAISTTTKFPDNTMDAFFSLGKAKNMKEVERELNGVRFIHLNIVAGDAKNIYWQVTGNYPLRKSGTGHFPSPGWTGEYDWMDSWGGEKTPRVLNPQKGFVATGNHRTTEPGFSPVLSSSWYYPERFERAEEMLAARSDHDAESMIAMQADRHDRLVGKVQKLWRTDVWHNMIRQGISELPEKDRGLAQKALDTIMEFDGNMEPESKTAAVWGAFEHHLIRAIFLDEAGPDNESLWDTFLAMNVRAYSAYQDHLLGRKTSEGDWAPFWDNVKTPEKENPGQIIAQALAKIWPYLEKELGKDESKWQWGSLANYHWRTDFTHMLPHLSGVKKLAVKRLAKYTDRGPFPAGGNRNTLNVAGYDQGRNYDVWNIPAMRMVVDFSKKEPLQLVIAGGQSGNPASPHYDDGIHLWLSRKNRTLPFNDQKLVERHYGRKKVLLPRK